MAEFTTDQLLGNPYPVYANLRTNTPITPITDSFYGKSLFVTRYEDALIVLKDPRFSNDSRKRGNAKDFTNAWWMPSVFRAFLNSMVSVDDPDHTRLRNLIHKAFTPRIVQDAESRIQQISQNLLDEMAAKREVNLIADFAHPLPVTVISEILGIPPQNRERFYRMTSQLLNIITARGVWDALKIMPSALRLNNFFKHLIKLRRQNPQDDLISGLVQAEVQGERLSEEELIAMLFLLLLAGHETTVNLIGNGVLALLEHPDQLAKLKADFGLADTAVEEILRFTNPVQHVAPRYALEDVEVNGQLIPKDTTVLVGIASANRDETVFPNAEQFDITRTPNRHIAFGFGIHYCVGAPLARLEGKVALTSLFTRFPDLQLAVPSDALQWGTLPSLRGLKSLPVRLTS